MTREEAIEFGKTILLVADSNDDESAIEFTQMAIQALSQEPCDDAISRILKKMWNCRGKHTTSIDKVAMEQIIRDELPPVTQKSGKWIVHPKGIYAHLVCNRCLSNAPYDYETNYCPNCGAKMESEEQK